MTVHETDIYTMIEGHPPSAARRVLVDFDKTIRPWGSLMSWEQPLPGAVRALQRLKAFGYEIIILTSRYSQVWWRDEAQSRGVSMSLFASEQMSYVRDYLSRFDIPFDRITSEKLPALVLFDDTAVRVSPEFPLGEAVESFLAQRGPAR